MAQYMMDIGKIIKFLDKEYMFGMMEEDMMVTGKITKWMDKEFILG